MGHHMRVISFVVIAAIALLMASCVVVPQIDGAAAYVPTDEIVRRIKCELVEAVKERSEDPRLNFLTQWSATVHLTRIVDGSSGINPGATLTDAIPGGSFSLGVGAGLTTQAVKTDELQFFLSFPHVINELYRPRKYQTVYRGCELNKGVLLDSDLGIGETIDKATAPILAGTLPPFVTTRARAGNAVARPPGEDKNIRDSLEKLRTIRLPDTKTIEFDFKVLRNGDLKFNNILKQLEAEKGPADAEKMGKNIVEAARIETETRSIVTNVVTPLADIAQTSIAGSCIKKVNDAKYQSITYAALVSLRKIDVDRTTDVASSDKALDQERQNFENALSQARNLVQAIIDCPIEPVKPPTPIVYDPIDTITATINFNITSSGSITPTWKLVRVSAPLNSTFASTTRKDTNTLILTMGRPAYQDGKPGPSGVMASQTFTSILSQALSNRVVP